MKSTEKGEREGLRGGGGGDLDITPLGVGGGKQSRNNIKDKDKNKKPHHPRRCKSVGVGKGENVLREMGEAEQNPQIKWGHH